MTLNVVELFWLAVGLFLLTNPFNAVPTTGTINTQQLIQMGTHTEKLQHTLQHLPATTGQQLQDEQIAVSELKQSEIQDPDSLEAANPTDPEGKRRREARLHRKSAQINDIDKSLTESPNDNSPNGAPHQGRQVNITV